MRYSQLDKVGAPHSFMRNAFVEDTTESIKKLLEEKQNEVACINMEIDTMEWELECRRNLDLNDPRSLSTHMAENGSKTTNRVGGGNKDGL